MCSLWREFYFCCWPFQKLREIAIHTIPQTNILLMEEILHQWIGSLSHYLQGFIHPRWCRISSINSSSWKWLVWRRLSFWDVLFPGSNVSLRECHILANKKNALLSRNSGGFFGWKYHHPEWWIGALLSQGGRTRFFGGRGGGGFYEHQMTIWNFQGSFQWSR